VSAARIASLGALVCAAAAAMGSSCGRGGGAVEPPAPELASLEQPVARRIEEASADVRRAPGSAQAWGRLAAVYDVHGLTAEAIACYERAVELDARDWRWSYHLGVAWRTSDEARALEHFRRAVQLEPGYAPLHVYLAHGFVSREELGPAERHARRAVELDPESVNGWLLLGRVALARGEREAALESFERALRLAPGEPAVHRQLAQLRRSLGDGPAAAEHERRAVEGGGGAGIDMAPLPDPVRDEIGWREGVSYFWRRARAGELERRGQGEAAIREWQEAVAEDPGSLPALLELARLLAAAQRFAEAEGLIRRALEIEPGSAAALAQLGGVLGLQGRVDEAIEAYEVALRADPRSVEAHNNLGGLLAQSGRLEEAIERLRASSEALPESVDVHYNLGAVLKEAGRLDEARQALERTLELDPSHAMARGLLGTVLAIGGRFSDAAREFELALRANPDDARVQRDLGRALWRAGRRAEAIGALRGARRRLADDPGIANELAWQLATGPEERLRDGREALEIARGLCEGTAAPNPQHLDTLAAALAETGAFEEAAAAERRAVAIVEAGRREAEAAGDLEPARSRGRLVEQLLARLRLYEAGRPYREGP
jgi:tetratricopeptide (TPR) repeat protein